MKTTTENVGNTAVQYHECIADAENSLLGVVSPNGKFRLSAGSFARAIVPDTTNISELDREQLAKRRVSSEFDASKNNYTFLPNTFLQTSLRRIKTTSAPGQPHLWDGMITIPNAAVDGFAALSLMSIAGKPILPEWIRYNRESLDKSLYPDSPSYNVRTDFSFSDEVFDVYCESDDPAAALVIEPPATILPNTVAVMWIKRGYYLNLVPVNNVFLPQLPPVKISELIDWFDPLVHLVEDPENNRCSVALPSELNSISVEYQVLVRRRRRYLRVTTDSQGSKVYTHIKKNGYRSYWKCLSKVSSDFDPRISLVFRLAKPPKSVDQYVAQCRVRYNSGSGVKSEWLHFVIIRSATGTIRFLPSTKHK